MANKCKCKNLESVKELVFFRGKSVVANATKCKECNKVYFSPREAESIRMELNPRFWEKVMGLFFKRHYEKRPFIFDGKIL